MLSNTPPVFRFAPSPNGALHLGHAYSALINQRMAQEVGGKLLLRIEDIDRLRCRPHLEEQMLEDLEWLGIKWDESPRRQSEHFDDYQSALDELIEAGLVYPAFLSRAQIRQIISDKTRRGEIWSNDPDGSPHYPGTERDLPLSKTSQMQRNQPLHALRLNMKAALDHIGGQLVWQETGGKDTKPEEQLAAPPEWGDVILARSDTPTSYHLSVVLDDALQGITHVVRGRDLFAATSVHRLLQTLLGLPVPVYHHHDLILDEEGRKLSKSNGDVSLRALREAGKTPQEIVRMVGL